MSSASSYRPDVDGLRAVAVLAVVVFHAHAAAAPGGYVGVDVFFVISGYLIAQIVHADAKAGRFTIAGFYERRVRRIAPALLAMLALCTPVFALYFAPIDFKSHAQSVAATLTFSSNVYFWLKSGYFDPGADARPLLHTWSLAVEEQYYLVFPLLVAWLYRRGAARRLLPVLAGLAGLSLVIAVVQLQIDRSGAFYLPLSRMWELLAGALLAIGGWRAPASAAGRSLLATASLALVLVPVALYDHGTPFPGLAAVPPVLGAVGLILAGTTPPGAALPWPNRLLASLPMVAVGRVSYSMYLWHWPIVVGAQYLLMRPLSGPLELGTYAAAVGLLSWLSWRYVEQPFRQGPLRAWTRPQLFTAAGAAAGSLLAGAVAVHVLHGLPGRFSEPGRSYAAAALDANPRRAQCDRPSPARIATGEICRLGLQDAGPPEFALLGDSFADALAPGIDRAAARAGQRGVSLTYSGCFPLPGTRQDIAACQPFVDEAMVYLAAHPSIRRVVVVGRWTSAYHGDRFGAFHADGWNIVDDASVTPGPAENARVFMRGMGRLLEALREREVTVVAHIPEQRYDVPRALLLGQLTGYPQEPSLPAALHEQRQHAVRAALKELQSTHRFAVLDVGARLCDAQQCSVLRAGSPLYADDNHLSAGGAVALESWWRPALGLPESMAVTAQARPLQR